MYTEIEIIETIECKKTKIELFMMFIEEYGGWVQHLRGVGKRWGAAGEEVGAYSEEIKCKRHIELLREKVLELSL